jgi:hypothetical protein
MYVMCMHSATHVCVCSAPRPSQWPRSPAAIGFSRLLRTTDAHTAFAEVYVAAFVRLDQHWLHSKATYMEFNQVMCTQYLYLRCTQSRLHFLLCVIASMNAHVECINYSCVRGVIR